VAVVEVVILDLHQQPLVERVALAVGVMVVFHQVQQLNLALQIPAVVVVVEVMAVREHSWQTEVAAPVSSSSSTQYLHRPSLPLSHLCNGLAQQV
jgi:hypothetical protein